jgi:proliferating cell nuclear antigen PCNA
MTSFLVSHEKSEIFQTLFQNIKNFSCDTRKDVIQLNSEKLFMQTMDPSHVSEMVLDKTWFDQYKVPVATRICFDVALFAKILSTWVKSDKQGICISLPEDADQMTITMVQKEYFYKILQNGTKSVILEKQFYMPLIKMDQDLLEIHETEYDADFSLLTSDLAEWIGQLRLFGDELDLQCSEKSILMKSISKEKGGMEGKFDIDKLVSFSINEGEIIRLSFSLTYLVNICSFQKVSRYVAVSLKSGNPMQVQYSLCSENSSYIRFYLAPRIECLKSIV